MPQCTPTKHNNKGKRFNDIKNWDVSMDIGEQFMEMKFLEV
jgi:hypothetical protein